MKVLFITDVHLSEKAVGWIARRGGEYDAVIVGGDLARGSASPEFPSRFLMAVQSSNKSVFFVPGNADPPTLQVPDGVTMLHGRKAPLGRYSAGGLGGSNPTPFNTPFELKDEEASGILRALGRVDLLVSHTPPAGTKCDRASAGHIGSVPVREYVESQKPVLVLSGHAHESKGVDNLGGTVVVNPGPLADGQFAEVTLDSIVSVELKSEPL